MLSPIVESRRRDPWNKGKLVGQNAALKLREIWAIRVRLELGDRKRELALFNLAIDSKLRGCDLVQLRVRDVAHGDRIAARTIIMNRRHSGRFSSKSLSSPENRSSPGSDTRRSKARIICFRAGYGCRRIYRPGNTLESSRLGSPKLALTPTPMEPIRCAARKPP
jgi:hypothetical protein